MKKALVVGLNRYPGHELKWCDNDAIAMAGLLSTNGDGAPNFDVLQITDACTKQRLQADIQRLFSDESELALLYFSGHGHDADGGYLVTTDFTDDKLGVRMEDILHMANESKCKNRIIILDCCYSGSIGESPWANSNSVLGNGVTIMAASLSTQEAEERTDAQHGVFTNLLIQGLNGGAADISGNITPASLYSFVDQSLGAWEQRPVFKTNISQFLPIRTISAKVPIATLRKLCQYFSSPSDVYPLNPSYEYTNDPSIAHSYIEPFADTDHVEIFKELQLFASVGLVEPVDADHMYFAAMESKACKLTALGLHYWRLSRDKRF